MVKKLWMERGKPVRTDDHLPPQHPERVAAARDRGVRWHDPVVLLEPGVEPRQARQAPRFVRAAVADGVGADGRSVDPTRHGRRSRGGDGRGDPRSARPRVRAAPGRRTRSAGSGRGERRRGREVPALPVHTALVEAANGGGRNGGPRSPSAARTRHAHIGERQPARPTRRAGRRRTRRGGRCRRTSAGRSGRPSAAAGRPASRSDGCDPPERRGMARSASARGPRSVSAFVAMTCIG